MGLPKHEAPDAPESQTELVDWAAEKKRSRRRSVSIGDSAWQRAREESREMMASGDWDRALPRHFAAAYEVLHERVYGVAPAELDSRGRALTAMLASRMLEREFGGERPRMADYVRWAWTREKGREEWRRRNNGGNGGRITPRTMFGPYMLTDYRIELARRAKLR